MADPTPKAGVNCDVTISLHASETLPTGLNDRIMGFNLARGDKGQAMWGVKDLAPAELIARVQAAGYQIDPTTLEMTFYKDNWSGPFGAYEERPGQNRPAIGVDVDFKGPKPICGPKQYTIATSAAAITDVKLFGSNFYACGGKYVYQIANWSTTPAFSLVFTHSVAVTFSQLHIHNGYLYANAGTTGAYAYTSDGTTWVESNRGGTDQQATEMANLRGFLHKRVGQNHYQLSAATSNGINGGEAWSSADQVDNTSYSVRRMFVAMDSLVFGTAFGLANLDGSGNFTELLPELQDMGPVGLSSCRVWDNNSILYPMATGAVNLYQEDSRLIISPMAQVERIVDISPMKQPPLNTKLTYTGAVDERLYALQDDATNERLMILEKNERGMGWRNLLGTFSSTGSAGRMWTLYKDSDGPVLFVTTSTTTDLYYYKLPLGSDATVDTRCKFAASCTIYDPWLTFGIPDVNKRWSYIKAACTQSTPANYARTTYTIDAINEAGSDVIASSTLTMAQGITIGTINFDANAISRRARLVHTLGNTGTSQEAETPIPLWIEVHAFALPTPKYEFSMGLLVPSATVGRGLATQDQARRFLAAVRNAQLPMTLTDRFGTAWTVNRVVGEPTESYANLPAGRPDEVYGLTLVQQVAGV